MSEEKPWIANVGEGYAEITPQDKGTVIISITEPGRKARIPKGYDDLLRLEFQDYDSAHTIPDGAVLFTARDAARISRFARKHRERGKNIMVHCAAGVSRSGAIAEALLQAFPEYVDRGWDRFPNGLVLTLMKRALGLVPIGATSE